ncbi:hypothetical protein DFH09DRAFT_1307196 [Mycena vulgaris]|nr:hypothetical protein DFH09DRAFT_1307196 [Mycena vulgaris]
MPTKYIATAPMCTKYTPAPAPAIRRAGAPLVRPRITLLQILVRTSQPAAASAEATETAARVAAETVAAGEACVAILDVWPGESVSSYPPLPPSSVSSYLPLPPSTVSSEQYHPPLPASTIFASSSSVSEISSLSFSTNSTSLPHLEPPTPYESSEESSDVATPMSLAFSSVSSMSMSGPSPIESRVAPSTLYEAPSELSRTIWGRASRGTYKSSILAASPSVGSIALHDAPDTSGETSFLWPTESISSFDRLSTIPGSIPSTVTPPLPSSLSNVSTPSSLGFPSDSSSSLGRTLSVLSQSSFMCDSSSVHSSVFDGSLPESEPLEEPATTSLLIIGAVYSQSSNTRGSGSLSVTTPHEDAPSLHLVLDTVPSCRTASTQGVTLEHLADELRRLADIRGEENHNIVDNVRALRDELRDLADFLHRSIPRAAFTVPSAPSPMPHAPSPCPVDRGTYVLFHPLPPLHRRSDSSNRRCPGQAAFCVHRVMRAASHSCHPIIPITIWGRHGLTLRIHLYRAIWMSNRRRIIRRIIPRRHLIAIQHQLRSQVPQNRLGGRTRLHRPPRPRHTTSPLRVPCRLCRAPRSYLPLASAARHRPAETYPALHVCTPQLPAPHPAKVDSPPPPPTVELSPRSRRKKSSSLLTPSALPPRTPSTSAALEDEVHPGSHAGDAALEHRARAAVFAAHRATPLRMPPLRLERLPRFPRCLHYHSSAPPVLDVHILLTPHPVHVAFRVDVLEKHRISPSHALATSLREPCALRSHPASPSPAYFASRTAPPPLKPTPAHISPPPALAGPTPAHVPRCSTSPAFHPAPVLEAYPPACIGTASRPAGHASAGRGVKRTCTRRPRSPRILPRLTCAAPISSPPAASLAPGHPANDNVKALNTNGAHKGLSAAALARFAPDPHAKRGWHRVRSHNAEVEALGGRGEGAEGDGARGVCAAAGAGEGCECEWGLEGGRAALRVLRIAVARPMYEAGAGGVLARASRSGDGGEEEGEGLALYVLFGARVERRTIEKNTATTDGTRITKGAPGLALLEVRSTVRAVELYKVMHTVLPRFPALHTLLLTRPSALYPPRPAEPPSLSFFFLPPSFFFLPPPTTPGFLPLPVVPHARAPGQTPLSLRVLPPPPFRGPPSEDVAAWLRWAVSPCVVFTLILTLPVPLALRLSLHWSRSGRP